MDTSEPQSADESVRSCISMMSITPPVFRYTKDGAKARQEHLRANTQEEPLHSNEIKALLDRVERMESED
jgi:hypothetical protein